MVIKTIDASTLQNMFLMGAKSIELKKEYINELNVFPVPDGDTGTNMSLTIMAAVKEVKNIQSPTMKTLAKAISSGSLRGARGNSGVILSQLFRGFTKEIAKVEVIDVVVMAEAMQRAVETAYKAVMRPKEGTILTVARAGAEKAAELIGETEDLVYFCDEVIQYMDEVLSKTPDMLPVLKEAGVVDSGGQGLVEILKGSYDALIGKGIDFKITAAKPSMPVAINNNNHTETHIELGYCTEFLISTEHSYNKKTEEEFKGYLKSIGDSIVVVSDEDIVKVHIHTNDPGLAIQKALTYGSLSNIKIDNMREEHNEKLMKDAQKKAEEQRKEIGFISVSIGSGINDIFKGLGIDYLIEGGQTMNPSTEDMLNAIEQVHANTIFIFPNNKNIILAAQQAKDLTKDKKVIVIPSKTIPQGITAIINFVPEKTIEENEKQMIEAMMGVKTGQVTYAVRDTTIDGKEISKGNIMGIGDTGILNVSYAIDSTVIELIELLIDKDSELVSLYYGEEIQEEDAAEIAEFVKQSYPDVEVEVQFGGQPIYYYIISVE